MLFTPFRFAPPDHLTIACATGTVKVRIRRNRRARRYTLRVPAAAAEPVLTLPARGTMAGAEAFLERHRGWLEARLADLPERRVLEHGGRIMLRGVEHVIRHKPQSRGTAWVDPEAPRPTIAVAGEEPHLPRRVLDLLKREARRDLEKAVRRYATALGVRPVAIRLRDTSSRWGSCSGKGVLSFSWRLIMAPPFVLDYLAAHEVAHLREMNHGHRFWQVVETLCPKYEAAEAWLKLHGSGLHAVVDPVRRLAA